MVSFGSGLGLYMLKKSAIIIGGCIECIPLDDGWNFVLMVPLELKDEKR